MGALVEMNLAPAEPEAPADLTDTVAAVINMSREEADRLLAEEIAKIEAENNAARDQIIAAQAVKPAAGRRVVLNRWPETSGMTLMVNGRRFVLPIGKPTLVPTLFLGALDSANADITVLGDSE